MLIGMSANAAIRIPSFAYNASLLSYIYSFKNTENTNKTCLLKQRAQSN